MILEKSIKEWFAEFSKNKPFSHKLHLRMKHHPQCSTKYAFQKMQCWNLEETSKNLQALYTSIILL